MKFINLKNLAVTTAFCLVAIFGTTLVASAQGHDRDDRKRQEKVERERAKAEQRRIAAENRQTSRRWQRDGYNNGQWNTNVTHYRVNRNGSYYNTDQRGAELLRQAVNSGYQQGYEAGRSDRSGRRRSSYSNSSGYQTGNYGYESYVDQSQYQYYFRQGFQRGYQDGYNSRNQYGSNSGGSVSILGSILGAILNIQTY
jgi:hypothetical protein